MIITPLDKGRVLFLKRYQHTVKKGARISGFCDQIHESVVSEVREKGQVNFDLYLSKKLKKCFRSSIAHSKKIATK